MSTQGFNLLKRMFAPATDYQFASWLFIKALTVIYFVAFLSLAVQITGLVGPHGILPYQEVLNNLYQQHGTTAWWHIPTLFWFSASDVALQLVTVLGCVAAVFLLLTDTVRAQRVLLIVLFVCYLSVYHAGQVFLNFQWDTLLMESGFLAIFLVGGSNQLVIFLFHWLLFRLRFMSGISKLVSGDVAWSNFSALNYYFETQPLPHAGSWYFHQLPDWLLKTGTGFTFFTELLVPFFIFMPRPFRLFAAAVTVFMQLLIIATSNHNFINLLTIILCLFLLDDKVIHRLLPFNAIRQSIEKTHAQPFALSRVKNMIIGITASLILVSSLSMFYSMVSNKRLPDVIETTSMLTRSYGLGHIYHVFPTMQVERHELQVEGSYDGVNWYPYKFRYKPQDLAQRPAFIVPHQPRLDWMIWFAPTQHSVQMRWFAKFMQRLSQGSPQVLALLAYNPFEKQPPVHLRVLVFRYHFTTSEERRATGNWWKREYLGEFPYVPPRRP